VIEAQACVTLPAVSHVIPERVHFSKSTGKRSAIKTSLSARDGARIFLISHTAVVRVGPLPTAQYRRPTLRQPRMTSRTAAGALELRALAHGASNPPVKHNRPESYPSVLLRRHPLASATFHREYADRSAADHGAQAVACRRLSRSALCYLWLSGHESFARVSFGFFLPTLIGNVAGGRRGNSLKAIPSRPALLERAPACE
jgi:hypothetical protein